MKSKPQPESTNATSTLAADRLAHQQIVRPVFTTPGELVTWMGAIQAQDYAAAKWAVGLRLAGDVATDAAVEDALGTGTILRTHALRWTWQLVAPQDIRWILALVSPRLVAGHAPRHRELKLDAATFRRSNVALARALRGGRPLTRIALAAALKDAGISAAGPRLSHLLSRAELDGLLCGGPRKGKQFTYVLLDDRVPRSVPVLARDEALGELALRYFRSRGPATLGDFAWWSGLTVPDARAGMESIQSQLRSDLIGGQRTWRGEGPHQIARPGTTHLLPAFDEYLVAYRDRDAVLDLKHTSHFNRGGGMLDPCIVVDGRVIGIWRRELVRTTVAIEATMFYAPTPAVRQGLAAAVSRYATFLGLDATFRMRTIDRPGRG